MLGRQDRPFQSEIRLPNQIFPARPSREELEEAVKTEQILSKTEMQSFMKECSEHVFPDMDKIRKKYGIPRRQAFIYWVNDDDSILEKRLFKVQQEQTINE